MNPIITTLEFGSLMRPIGGYGLMMTIGVVVGALLMVLSMRRSGDDVGAGVAALGFVAMGALAGSWSLAVMVEGARTGEWIEALSRGGLVFLGAPIGGLASLILVRRGLALQLGRFLDLSIPAIPAAHAMGRIGCLLGGCCFGAAYEGPGAIRYVEAMAPAAHPSILRHASPLYEAGGLLVLAMIFALVPRRGLGRGERFAAYFAGYSLLRLGVERTRGDAVRGTYLEGLVSTSDLLSLVILLGAIGYLVWSRGRGRAAHS